jgi:hypothetical protein
VIRNVINPPEDIMAKIQEAEKKQSYQYNELDFLKAAHKTAQKEDAPADEPPIDEKAPADDEAAPTDEKAPVDEAVPDETAPEAPAEETPPEGVPPEAAPEEDIQVWKNQVKKKLLKELTDEIMNEFEGEPGEGGPRELETLDETLIQPSATAAMRHMWKMKTSWDKYLQKKAGNLNKNQFNRLRFGTYMLLASDDMKVLADYGYNKRDFLAVMSCLDNCFKNPLDLRVKKAVAVLGGTHGKNPKSLVNALEKLSGRKLKPDELRKVFTWLKLMDSYSS